MKLIPCGTEVILKLCNLKGMVTEISIRFSSVRYRVSYFHTGEYKDIWISEEEFIADKHEKKRIGFL